MAGPGFRRPGLDQVEPARSGRPGAIQPRRLCQVARIRVKLSRNLPEPALQTLGMKVSRRPDALLAAANDAGSAAVLVAVIGAAIVAILVFWPYIKALLK